MNRHLNRHVFTAAFFLGALGIVWVGSGFLRDNRLALTMTVLIGLVYLFGALELRQFRQASASLAAALAAIPDDLQELGDWLASVPAPLQNSVRLRIEGERVGLPGPALTPYLVGLLVMLGMLGTFLGMVVTLNGAVFALEKTTDLQAMRAALALPIKGLGLAFGTSVAGVAASSMLGLMSALSRRDRMLAVQLLDTRIATGLRRFSLTHQRQETFKALQLQSRALPQVVDQLQAMMTQMKDMNQQLGEQLGQRLLGNQESFHSDIKGVYTGLATAVDTSLRDSLRHSAEVAGASLMPVVEAAMNGIARDTTLMHERMAATVQQQLDGIAAQSGVTAATQAAAQARLHDEQATRNHEQQQAWTQALDAVATGLTRQWQDAGAHTLAQQQQLCDTLARTAHTITGQASASTSAALADTTRLISSAEVLMQSRIDAEARWIDQQRDQMTQLASLLRAELGALRDDEAVRGDAAVARLAQLQTALTSHLTTLGTALEAPISRLIETASEAPRAAADVISQLRQEISGSVARDNALLEERSRILDTLNTLLDGINHASVEQRAVIDTLVASSARALGAAGDTFAANVASESGKLADIAAHVTSSAVDVASLGETFGFAVQSFNDANAQLIASLQRIEGALDKSLLRSDEQLAYYVAQARDIIDLSMLSQKEIFDELRQLPGRQAGSSEGAG